MSYLYKIISIIYPWQLVFIPPVILLPLCPVSLIHKNPQRRKIIHEMRAVEREERSIDLKMIFWYNILFVRFLSLD